MEPLDLFSAMTDVDDQDVLEALDVYARKPKRKRFTGTIVVAATLIVLVSAGVLTHWLLQKEKNSTEKGAKQFEVRSKEGPPTITVEPDNSPMPIGKLSVCEIYQFMLWEGTEYIASLEDNVQIGPKIGTARVRNEEKESVATLFKDVIVFEFEGIDSKVAVIVYYPEEQEYHAYYSSAY